MSSSDIIKSITEYHHTPIRIGSRCESNTYYRVENLPESDVEICAEELSENILNIISPVTPDIIISLPGDYIGLASIIAKKLSDLTFQQVKHMKITPDDCFEKKDELKDKNIILVDDVITTATTCLAYHTQIFMGGASIVAWATLIDRTFGPGPVPIVSLAKGEEVRLLQD